MTRTALPSLRAMVLGATSFTLAAMPSIAFSASTSFFSAAAIFAKDADVVVASADYLKSFAIDCIFTAFLFCFIGYFNGCGKTFFVMLQGIIGAFCVRIPVAFFISKSAGVTLFKLGLATPCSTFVQILLCIMYFFLNKNKKNKGFELES